MARDPLAAVLAQHARALTTALRADGRHDHLTVRTARGFVYIDVAAAPTLRLEPLGLHRYAVSFHTHVGRWEPTPVQGPLDTLAGTLLTVFAPHLEPWDFPPTKSGSDH